MSDHYDALGIQRSASPSMVKMAYEGRLKALAKEKLPPQQHKAEEKVLQQAFAVLSDAKKREWYDRQLESEEAADEAQDHSPRSPKPLVMAGAAAVVLAMAAGGYYFTHPSAEKVARERAEQQARAKKAYDDKMGNIGANKNPNPFRNNVPSETKDRMIQQAAEREAKAQSKQ